MSIIEGQYDGSGHRCAIVVSRFNQSITSMLLKGAVDGLKKHEVKTEDIDIVWVPGAFEIPLIAKTMAESNRYTSIICLGVVIRGETAHFDYVAGQAASGILQSSLSTGIPVIFSVLTTETEEQAQVRASPDGHNLGFQGALCAIEMANLLALLKARV